MLTFKPCIFHKRTALSLAMDEAIVSICGGIIPNIDLASDGK